jgi:hypothetical protein
MDCGGMTPLWLHARKLQMRADGSDSESKAVSCRHATAFHIDQVTASLFFFSTEMRAMRVILVGQ